MISLTTENNNDYGGDHDIKLILLAKEIKIQKTAIIGITIIK